MIDEESTTAQLTGELHGLRERLERTEARLRDSEARCAALRQSEAKYRGIFDNTVEGIFQVGPEGQFLTANHALARMLGYAAPAELVAEVTAVGAQLVVDDAPRTAIRRLLEEHGSCQDFEVELCRKDGSRLWTSVSARVCRERDGRLLYYEGTVVDIHQRKQAERALRESHSLLQAVLEGIPEAVYVKDLQGRYLVVSREGARLVGKTVDEVLGRDDTALFAPETARRFMESDRRVYETGSTEIADRVATAAGVTRTFLTTKVPFRGPGGEICGVLGVSRDISARKQAEEALRRQHEIFQTIFDHIPVMINFVDPAGRVQLVNRHWEQVTGWSREEARNMDMAAAFYPDPLERQRVLEYVRNPPPGWADFRLRVRDGRLLDTMWANVLLSDGMSIGFGQDVTERKQAEAVREQSAARLQALSRRLVEVQEEERRHLARELHDEIGQILTSLKFALEAGAAAPPAQAGAKLGEARALIEEALTRVRTLSFDLRPALLDHLGLLPALRGLIERCSGATGLRVGFEHAGLERRFAPELETAAYRIVQEALTNVARHARTDDAAVRVWATADALEVQVEDQGVGFNVQAALVPSRSNGLTGMQERVLLLGGRWVVESTPGDGTHVLAKFPLAGPRDGTTDWEGNQPVR